MVKKSKKSKSAKSRQKPANRPSFWSNHTNKWMVLSLFVITFAAFFPVLNNEFVNWDDDRNIYENEQVLNLNWENIKVLFTTDVIGNYNPLSNLSLAIEHYFFQGSDNYHMWFHLDNLLLHLICVFFVFRIGIALKLNQYASLLLALLFAIHPMRVESVAWITERKDVLFGAFFLSSMFYYIQFVSKGLRKHLIISFALFAIGLFAKIQMVTLPLSLVLIDYYLKNTHLMKSALSKWPYFLLSLLFGALGIYILGDQGSLDQTTTFGIIDRLFVGSLSFCVYVAKAVFPYKMSPLYPYPPELHWTHYASMAPFLIMLGGLLWAWIKEKKVWFFGGGFFLANIMFLLQILGAGQGYLADRFTYIAYFGLFFIAAYYFQRILERYPKKKTVAFTGVGILILFYAWLTFNQTKIWKNSETLWTHVLKHYTMSTLPYGNRANYYRDLGKKELALKDYSSSIRLKQDNPAPYNSRAKLYFGLNRDQEAIQDYNKAIELDPNNAEYVINRGAAYAKLRMWDKALADLNKGIEINPRSANGYLNRSILWQQKGRMDLCLNDLQAYLSLNPTDGDIWYESARVRRFLGNDQKALEEYNLAIRYKPNNPLFYVERAKTYYALGKMQEAATDARKALNLGGQLGPEFTAALKSQNLL